MKAGRRHKKKCGSCWTFFAPPSRTVTVLSIKEKHRTSIFNCINARQRAPPQMCAAGNHAARGSCGHFSRSASRLQHVISENSQICKVHGFRARLSHGQIALFAISMSIGDPNRHCWRQIGTVRSRYKRIVYERMWVASLPFRTM